MEKENLIISKLDEMQSNINYIKEHLEDVILTEDDINSVEEAEKDLEESKTKRL